MFNYDTCWVLYSKASNYLLSIVKSKVYKHVWIFEEKQINKQTKQALVLQFFENQEALVEVKPGHLLAINPFL